MYCLVGEIEEERLLVLGFVGMCLDDGDRFVGENVGGIFAKVGPRHVQVSPEVVAPSLLIIIQRYQIIRTLRYN